MTERLLRLMVADAIDLAIEEYETGAAVDLVALNRIRTLRDAYCRGGIDACVDLILAARAAQEEYERRELERSSPFRAR